MRCLDLRTRIRPFLAAALLILAALPTARPAYSQCGWAAGLHSRDFDRAIFDFVIWDNGSGPALYAAGEFDTVDGIAARGVARWDGYHWWPLLGSGGSSLADSPGGPKVFSLEVWDDGGGPSLYAAGRIDTADGKVVENIARWDGTDWWPLDGAMGVGVDAEVEAMIGFGGYLYVAGSFEEAGGVEASYIARWDGSEWSPLNGSGEDGVNSEAYALAVWDDGRGPALFVGGAFDEAGGLEALGMARWDGSAWESLGIGAENGIDDTVYALTGYGGVLAVGGDFQSAGGQVASHFATWDGTTWAAPSGAALGGEIQAFEVWNADLYAAGDDLLIDGLFAGALARWDGVAWHPVLDQGGLAIRDNEASAITVFDDGRGEALWVGGDFQQFGDHQVDRIGLWDGGDLIPLPSRAGGMDEQVQDFTVWDDGSGPALYAVGFFDVAGAEGSQGIARWEAGRWSALPGVSDDWSLNAITVFGGELYVGGNFDQIGEATMNNIARFDGTSWSPLTGASGTGTDGSIFDMITWDDGSGPALFLGGNFMQAGGGPAERIARWDGTDFTALGSGLDEAPVTFATWDDGAGEALYVGGRFIQADGVVANRVARWDGMAWSTLTGALGTGTSGDVGSLAVWNGELYAGGRFARAGGVTVDRIARWDGAEWSGLVDSTGAVGLSGARVSASTVWDSNLVIATAQLNGGAGAEVDRVSAWNGSDWQNYTEPMAGPDRSVFAVRSYDLGAGPVLAVGGPFDQAGGAPSAHVAFWSCDDMAPSAPSRLESTSHSLGVISNARRITVEWEGASDLGPLGLWGDSWVFNQEIDTIPDDRMENGPAFGISNATSPELTDGFGYYFHLKTCDRNRGCTLSHLGPFHIGDAVNFLFYDGFESGDLSSWTQNFGE